MATYVSKKKGFPRSVVISAVDGYKSAKAAATSGVEYVDCSDLTVQGDGVHMIEASALTVGDRTLTELISAGIWDAA